jgi:ribonucleoside-diphosphate reductase alpha chain
MKRVEASGCGEPGVYWTNNCDWGTNPCCEISLRPCQFCNLTEVNASDVVDQDDLNRRAKAAALIGTLQAGYTDFHYLRPIWKQTTEEEALVGIGMTGIGSGKVSGLDLTQAANVVIEENSRVAKLIGVNSAARTTTVKPSGTSSLVVGSSSGIHAWHNDYYIRRMRLGKDEALYHYLLKNMPDLVDDDEFNPSGAVASFPQKAPEGAIYRTESMLDLLQRVLTFNTEWVRSGHVKGDNTHNVSCTISIREGEWSELTNWMWENRDGYNGISVIPYDGGTYVQAPFEDCSEAEYERLNKHLTAIDLTQVRELDDNTDLSGEAACAGGLCEI